MMREKVGLVGGGRINTAALNASFLAAAKSLTLSSAQHCSIIEKIC